MITIIARPICLVLWLTLPLYVWAQTPTATETPAIPHVETDITSTSTQTPTIVLPTEINITPTPEGCRPLMFKAMAADMKAFTAQSQKLELTKQGKFFEEAVSTWMQAVEQCEDLDKEQAKRNLVDSQKMYASISEQLGSGLQCAAIHKDAETLQDMAKQALGDRRWNNASILFYKSKHMWKLATELCIGSQREIANRRQDEVEIDGHNAEFCAPLFEKAREQTLKLRSLATTSSPDDKQNASMVAETLWRDAMSQCKGSKVQDTARNNAQAIARERGTPWVSRVEPSAAQTTRGLKTPQITTTTASMRVPEKSNLISISGVAQTPTLNSAKQDASHLHMGTPSKTKTDTALVLQPKQPKTQPPEFNAEDAKGLSTYSGNGKVVWASGAVFEGDLVKGQRHGKGLYFWANGQSYNGDWIYDKPMGKGNIKFADGNQYEGNVLDGVPQGQGYMRYTSGDTYTGNFNAGTPEGFGVYVWKNGQQFKGNWKNGHPHGQGSTLFASGGSYVGNYVDGELDGFGEYHFNNGDKYIGQWKAGKKHGQGIFIWKSGERWEGIFENNEQTGSNNSPLKN